MIKIMVVDDEHDIAALFKQQFRKEIREKKVDFHFAFSAEDALKYLENALSADIVLILSDINMPGMNGLELLRIIKERFSYLKVFMITAYNDKEKYDTAIRYGAEDFLAKPIDFEKLKNQISLLQNT